MMCCHHSVIVPRYRARSCNLGGTTRAPVPAVTRSVCEWMMCCSKIIKHQNRDKAFVGDGNQMRKTKLLLGELEILDSRFNKNYSRLNRSWWSFGNQKSLQKPKDFPNLEKLLRGADIFFLTDTAFLFANTSSRIDIDCVHSAAMYVRRCARYVRSVITYAIS